MLKSAYLTVHEFAALHNVNKRTLHYYDSIGIFSPKKVGQNGYRYYTYMQSAEFEIILALRELGMSIEEIRDYQQNRNSQALSEMLLEKSCQIDEKIKQLKSLKATLNSKRENLLLSQSEQVKEIDVVHCKAEYLLLSDISHVESEEGMDEEVYKSLAQYRSNGKAVRAFNSSYGSMLEVPRMEAGDFSRYQYLFVKIPEPGSKKGLFLKTGGDYLRGFCKGEWSGIPDTYRRMQQYAKEHHLKLSGYCYEEGINEMGIGSMEAMSEYVTQITIPCAPEE